MQKLKILTRILNQTIICVFIVLTQISCSSNSSILNSAENWAYKRIYHYHDANMSVYSDDEKMHVLRGNFIAGLLTNSVYNPLDFSKETDRFISITNAIIEGDVHLTLENIPFPVFFRNCEFRSNFISLSTIFQKRIFFTNCRFNNIVNFERTTCVSLDIIDSNFTEPNSIINFRDVIVDRDLSIIGSDFEGGVSFASIKVGGSISGGNSKFNNKTKPVSFNSMQVDAAVYFNNACFCGPVDGRGMQLNSQLQLQKAKFLGEKEKVKFSNINVRDIILNDAEFNGPVSFDNSNIKGFFNANNAQFCSATSFSDATFGSLSITDSNFTDPNSVPLFTFMHVKGSFQAQRNNFFGGSNFLCSKIGENFICSEANFYNKINEASFFGMQIKNLASFVNTSFSGPVKYLEMQACFISLEGANFLSEDKTANFQGIKISQSVIISNAVFKGPVSFQAGSVGAFFLANDTQFVSESKLLDLRHLSVAGKVILSGTVFKGPVDLEGFKYNLIEIDEHEISCEYMLNLVEQANYTPDVYMTLENYCLKQGNSKMADKVYIASKRRQRKISFSLGNWLLDFLFRYGRKTERVFIIVIAPMLIIGTIVFRPKYMVPVNKEGNYINYSPFFYSLDLFIPLINIFWAKDWIPKKECRRLHIYMVFHVIIGWITIPLGLAAWMGIIN
jgi:hypothetical protein